MKSGQPVGPRYNVSNRGSGLTNRAFVPAPTRWSEIWLAVPLSCTRSSHAGTYVTDVTTCTLVPSPQHVNTLVRVLGDVFISADSRRSYPCLPVPRIGPCDPVGGTDQATRWCLRRPCRAQDRARQRPQAHPRPRCRPHPTKEEAPLRSRRVTSSAGKPARPAWNHCRPV